MPDRDKLERFIQGGGDVSTIPDDVWTGAGLDAGLRTKVDTFRRGGGDMATFKMPSAPAPVSSVPSVSPQGPAAGAPQEEPGLLDSYLQRQKDYYRYWTEGDTPRFLAEGPVQEIRAMAEPSAAMMEKGLVGLPGSVMSGDLGGMARNVGRTVVGAGGVAAAPVIGPVMSGVKALFGPDGPPPIHAMPPENAGALERVDFATRQVLGSPLTLPQTLEEAGVAAGVPREDAMLAANLLPMAAPFAPKGVRAVGKAAKFGAKAAPKVLDAAVQRALTRDVPVPEGGLPPVVETVPKPSPFRGNKPAPVAPEATKPVVDPVLSPREAERLAARKFAVGDERTVSRSGTDAAELPPRTVPVPKEPPRGTEPPPRPVQSVPPEPAPSAAPPPVPEAPRPIPAAAAPEQAPEVPRGAGETAPVAEPAATPDVAPATPPVAKPAAPAVHPAATEYLGRYRTDGPEAAADYYRALDKATKDAIEKSIPPASDGKGPKFGIFRLRKWADDVLKAEEGGAPAAEASPAPQAGTFGSRTMGRGSPRGGAESGALRIPGLSKPQAPAGPKTAFEAASEKASGTARSAAKQIAERLKATGDFVARMIPGTKSFRRTWLDRIEPVETAERAKSPTGQVDPAGPTAYARVASRGSAGPTRAYTFGGELIGSGTHKSLVEILSDVAKPSNRWQMQDTARVREFENYVRARRGQDYHARGLEYDLTPAEVQAILDHHKGNAVFDKAFREFSEWQNRPFEMLLEEIGMEPAQIAELRKNNPNFTHIERVFADEWAGGGGIGKGMGVIAHPIKSLRGKGAATKVIHPIEAAIANTERVMQSLGKARFQRKLVEWAEKYDPNGDYVKKGKPVTEKTRFELDRIKTQVENALGVTIDPAQAATLVDLWTTRHKARLDENIVTMFRKGKPVSYEIHPDLMRVVADVGPEGALFSTQLARALAENPILGGSSRAVKFGATGVKPGFSLLANPARDLFESMVNSGYRPGAAYGRGLKASVGRNPQGSRLYDASGAQASSFANVELGNPAGATGDVLRAAGGTTRGKVFNKTGVGVRALKEMSEVTERIPREGEFISALREAGWKEGGPPPTVDQIVAAANKAADVTVDFSRSGEWGRVANAVIPFFNPALQGMNRQIRLYHKSPGKAFARSATVIGVPTAVLWYLNRDRPGYRPPVDDPESGDQKAAWQRMNYWNAQIGDTEIQIPKPQGLTAAFSNIVEAMLDAMYRDGTFPQDLEDTLRELAKTATPSYLPVPLDIKEGLDKNEDTFTGRPIVPRDKADLPPEEQFDERTTKAARKFGAATGTSPMKADWVANKATGGLAGDVIGFAERVSGADKDVRPYAKPPVIGRFLSTPTASDDYEGFWKVKREIEARVKSLRLRDKEPERGAPTHEIDPRIVADARDMAEELVSLRDEATHETDPEKKRKAVAAFKTSSKEYRRLLTEVLEESRVTPVPTR